MVIIDVRSGDGDESPKLGGREAFFENNGSCNGRRVYGSAVVRGEDQC